MATISTPVRQPFGVLNDSKLRSLQSIKNRQNAVTPSSAPNLKRRAPSPELSDSENVDPSFFESSIKRKRAALEDDVSLAKQPRIMTKVVPPSSKVYTPTAVASSHTPKTDVFVKPSSTPASAPAAAGRSPTRLHAVRDKLQPRRRFMPPSLGNKSPSLSIAAALRGTLARKRSVRTKKPGATLKEAQPKSWSFDIFEESEEQQDYRMCEWTMTQSSAALEISDEEGKAKTFDGAERNDRGKENVDPNEMFVTSAPVTRAAAAAAAVLRADDIHPNTKSEEARTPLGDLDAAEFYGEGLDATSVVVVHDDVLEQTSTGEDVGEPQAEQAPSAALSTTPLTDDFTFEAHAEPKVESLPEVEDIPGWARQASLSLAEPPQQDDFSEISAPGLESADIDIWESESAKDENEPQEDTYSPCVVIKAGQTISLSGGCLHEL